MRPQRRNVHLDGSGLRGPVEWWRIIEQRMVTVRFTSHLRQHLSAPDCTVEAVRVGDALDRVFTANPELRGYVVDDQGSIRKHVAVFLNGTLVKDRSGLSDPVKAGDQIYVLQALSGG